MKKYYAHANNSQTLRSVKAESDEEALEKFKEIFGTEGRFKTYFVPERTEIIGDGDQKIPTTRRKKGVYSFE